MTEPGTLDIEELERLHANCLSAPRSLAYHAFADAAILALPVLIAEVKRLRAELAELKEEIREGGIDHAEMMDRLP